VFQSHIAHSMSQCLTELHVTAMRLFRSARRRGKVG
jgi:hypothetical protein